ncbi:MAG: glycosyltransferase [bacterium]|jgi:glycosyltransferase involved in cell wall biosynthesis
MKVLMLADGRSVHSARYLAEMRNSGVEISLASLEPGESVDKSLKRKCGINFLDYLLCAGEISRLAKAFKPDIINPHFASGYGFSTAFAGLHREYPVLLHCLGSDILISPTKSALHRARVRYALKQSDHILVDSAFLGEQVRKLDYRGDFAIIPWGLEDEYFSLFENKIAGKPFDSAPLKIIVPRPHNKIYNNRFIIESLAGILKEGNLIITFPDWGDEVSIFRKEVERLGIGEAVRFYGRLSRKEFIPYYASFDIYLSASLSDSSPASLLEAMGIGLFPIAADIPGVREWVGETNGALFDPGDPASLQGAVEKLLNDSYPVEKILESNHRMAMSKARFSENIATTIKVMERIIDRRAG